MVLLPRLKKRSDFLRVAKKRNSFVTSSLIVQLLERPTREDIPSIRVGFTASKKVGGAVVRNRAKRRLREVAQQVLSSLKAPTCDIVLIARWSTPTVSFQKLIEDCQIAVANCIGTKQE